MMISSITDIIEIDKDIRNELIRHSELNPNRVLNAISVRGQDLSKLVDERTYMSYNLSDCFIIFEVVMNTRSSDNVIMTESDESITDYSVFDVKVTVYGNKSNILCHLIKSRMLTEEARYSLYSKGIWLKEIGEIQSVNEFINNTIWPRTDFDITVGVRLSFNKIISDDTFEELNDIEVIKI